MIRKYLGLCLIAVAGVFFLALVTSPYGIAVSPDSVNYLSAAKNFTNGQGLFTNVIRWNSRDKAIPMIHWPPIFSLAIAALYHLGVDLILAAKLINVSLLGLNSFLIGFILLDISDSKLLSYIGSALSIVFYPLYYSHSHAWSEPLFIFLLLAALFSLHHHLKNNSLRWLLLAGALAGLSWVTRYAGLMVNLTASIALLIMGKKTWPKRFWTLLLYGVTSIIPTALWSYRNYKILGSPIDTWKGVNFRLYSDIIRILRTISGWAFPYWPTFLAAILLILLLAGVLLPLFFTPPEETSEPKTSSLTLWGLFVIIYAISLLLLSSFFSNIPINDRLLTPLFPPLLITLLLAVWARKGFWAAKIPRHILLPMLLIFVSPILFKAASWGRNTFLEGQRGYTAKRWRESECVKWLNNNPLPGRVLFSRANDALVILTNYQVRDVLVHREQNQLSFFCDTLSHFKGLVVYFDDIDRPHHFSEEEMLATGRFIQIASFADGRIYELKDE